MWLDKIKADWDKNPLQVIMIGALATTAVTKVIDVMSAAQGRRAYARQVDYKVRNRK